MPDAVAVIDAHAHLTDPRLAGDLEAVLEHAAAAGLTRILTCGEDLASSESAARLASGSSMVRAAVGLHPHRAASFDGATVDRLRVLVEWDGVVGIGEIGIDLSGRSAPLGAQEAAFAAQLRLAAELDLPVTVHVRDSGDAVRRILDEFAGLRGHVHCYSEGPPEVDDWVRRGLHLSFAGTVTYPRNRALRQAVRQVPLDRLLVETDAPYLAPQARRGRRNEPAFIADTYQAIARERVTDARALAEQVGRNAAALFGARW